MVSEVLTTLSSGHHLGEGSRCHVPAADSQQGLQVGVDLLQVVEPLIPGTQHFHQTFIMSKPDHRLLKRNKRRGKNWCEGILYSIHNDRAHNASCARFFFKNWPSGFSATHSWIGLCHNTLTPASTPRLH